MTQIEHMAHECGFRVRWYESCPADDPHGEIVKLRDNSQVFEGSAEMIYGYLMGRITRGLKVSRLISDAKA